MNHTKALRHLLSVELRKIVRQLERLGKKDAVEKFESLAKSFRFESGGDSPEIDDDATAKTGQNGPTLSVSLVGRDGGTIATIVRRRTDFAFYARQDANTSDLGKTDPALEKNVAAARAILREAWEKSGFGSIDPVLEAIFKGSADDIPANEPCKSKKFVYLALAGLCLINFILAYWGQTRFHHFLDPAYLLENVHRILDGQVPYRDFSLVLPPLHFYLNAAVLWLFGDKVINIVYATCVIQVLIVLASYWICQLLADRPWRSLAFAAAATVSGPAVWSFASYTIDASLAFAVAMGLLLLWEKKNFHWLPGLLAGIMLSVGLLIKQNSGLATIAGVFAMLLLGKILFRHFKFSHYLSLLIGLAIPILLFVAWLWHIDGLRAFYEDNVLLPAKLRMSVVQMLASSITPRMAFTTFYWLWLFAIWAAIFLAVAGWFTGTHRRPVQMLLVFPLLAFSLGCMQAQGLRTVFGMGPVVPIILALSYRFFEPLSRRWANGIVFGFLAAFLATGMYDTITAKRLNLLYNIAIDDVPFTLKKFEGISANRDQRDSFESAVAATERLIPKNEAAFYWPGDRAFYYATDRQCPFRHFQLHPQTGYTIQDAMAEFDEKRLKWLVVRKSAEQYRTSRPVLDDTPEFQTWLKDRYELVEEVKNHLIYRRTDGPMK
jgi:hypothetical protein